MSPFPHLFRTARSEELIERDVTDHLQLLLRKSGYYLHTSAEKEVVRTIKEKTCYLALNPQKEEKDQAGAWEEFRLPDGKVMRVYPIRLF
jgi:centractin